MPRTPSIKLPKDKRNLDVGIGDKVVRLTNLDKLFWRELGITKGALIQYYADVAPLLLPHIARRAMVTATLGQTQSAVKHLLQRAGVLKNS